MRVRIAALVVAASPQVGDTCYAYAMNGAGKQAQTMTSTDLVHWKPGLDALPKNGRWGSATGCRRRTPLRSAR